MTTTYRLEGPARVSTHDRVLGLVVAEFDAGEHEPKSEQEEVALAALAKAGLAEVVPDRPAQKRRRAKE